MSMEMDWIQSVAGRALIDQEAGHVRIALDSMFGDQFLQIGAWGADRFPVFARTQRAAVVSDREGDSISAITELDHLGIAADSIDVVLLPHVLETHGDPHGVLREVDRVLRSDGHIIILGFSPVSLWGLRHLVTGRRFPPVIQRMISEHRLRDWLRLLNYSVDHSSFRYFHAPMFRRGAVGQHGAGAGPRPAPGCEEPSSYDAGRSKSRLISALRSSHAAALQAWRNHAPFAGCYILVARKELYTMTPVRPTWKRRVRLVGGLVNPTTRNAA
jgi:SAM-dependent methyltransferase